MRAAAAPSSAASSRSMRVASAHSGRSQHAPPELSVNDVYRLAERTRMRTSLEARLLVLARTQKAVRADSGMSRPETGWSRGYVGSRGSRMGSTPGHVIVKRRLREDFDEGDEDEGGPGFVRNVEISVKPRTASAHTAPPPSSHSGQYSRTASGRVASGSARTATRLGSALTTASSLGGSDLVSCASPRPSEPELRRLSVARQCCEVMGPGVCTDCRKLRVRMMDRARMEADFPRLRVSEKNVTTSAILMRIFPDLTQAEIQDKIARGEIATDGLAFPQGRPRRRSLNDDDDDSDDSGDDTKLRYNGLHPARGSDDDDDDDDEYTSQYSEDERGSGGGSSSNDDDRMTVGSSAFLTQPQGGMGEERGRERPRGKAPLKSPRLATTKKISPNNPLLMLTKLKMKLGSGEASTPLFFMDLKHMNSKIFQGKMGRTLQPLGEAGGRAASRLGGPAPDQAGDSLHPGDGAPAYPTFVSPRKATLVEEPTYKAYFDPPLLAKHKQKANPSFFAGSDDPYSLPERLPDVITFADGKMAITDPSAAMRSESSMSFVSSMGDGQDGPELSGRGDVFKASKEPAEETVHE